MGGRTQQINAILLVAPASRALCHVRNKPVERIALSRYLIAAITKVNFT
jgi:hypothetical protein